MNQAILQASPQAQSPMSTHQADGCKEHADSLPTHTADQLIWRERLSISSGVLTAFDCLKTHGKQMRTLYIAESD